MVIKDDIISNFDYVNTNRTLKYFNYTLEVYLLIVVLYVYSNTYLKNHMVTSILFFFLFLPILVYCIWILNKINKEKKNKIKGDVLT